MPNPDKSFAVSLSYNQMAALRFNQWGGYDLRIMEGGTVDDGAYSPPQDIYIAKAEGVHALHELLAQNLPISPAEINYMSRALGELASWGCKVEVTIPQLGIDWEISTEDLTARQTYVAKLLGQAGFNVTVRAGVVDSYIKAAPIGGYINPLKREAE
jgi:hypothetical protein